MWSRTKVWIVAAAVIVAGCTSKQSPSSDDPLCSAANCQALIDSCHLEPVGMPTNVATCAQLPDGGQADVSSQLLSYCQQACNAQHQGAVVSCIAGQAGLCEDGGVVGQVAAAASCETGDAGSPNQTCLTSCQSALTTCNSGCSTTDTDACLDCGYDCGQKYVTCARGC